MSDQDKDPLVHPTLGTHTEAHKLYKKDPEEFESYKRLAIKEYIDSLPEEKRQAAIRTQSKIDNELRRIKNPQVRAEKVYRTLMESFSELNDKLKVFKDLDN